MITAEQCEAASELLMERAEIAEPLVKMRAAKKIRIAYQVQSAPGESGGDKPRYFFRDGPEVPMSAEFRALLTRGVEKELAVIDAKLRALGVTPPTEESP